MTHDLSEYSQVSLRNPNVPGLGDASGMMKPVNVEDIEAALSEMLPLVSHYERTFALELNLFLRYIKLTLNT